MSKTTIKKLLKSMPKDDIISMVLEMYDARKEAKEYLEFYANPNEDGKLEEYKNYYGRILSFERPPRAQDSFCGLPKGCV